MFTINAFGSTSEIALTVLGQRAVWCSHLFQVYAAAPEGTADKNGTRLIPDWKRELAGLAGPTIDVERSTNHMSLVGWIAFPVVGSALARALKACAVVCEPDSARHYGTVVAFQGTDAVATDGFRLTWTASGFNSPTMSSVCLPGHTIKPLLAFLKKAGDEIQGFLSEDETSLCFVGAGAYFFARLSAVKYPNWSGVVPTKFSATLTAEEVARLQDDAAQKKRAAKRSEAVLINLGGHAFSARFVAELPKGCTVQLGAADDDACLASADGVKMVLAPVRDNKKEGKAS